MNNEPLITNPQLFTLLSKNGWSPDRQVDLPDWMINKSSDSLISCPASERILRNFGYLEINISPNNYGPVELIWFEPNPSDEKTTQMWKRRTGMNLFYIASVDVQAELLINEDGECYISMRDLWKVGGNIDEALAYLFLGMGECPMIARGSQ